MEIGEEFFRQSSEVTNTSTLPSIASKLEEVQETRKIQVTVELNFSISLSDYEEGNSGAVSVETIVSLLKSKVKMLERNHSSLVLAQKSEFNESGAKLSNKLRFKEGERIQLLQLDDSLALDQDEKMRRKRKQACVACRSSKVHCSGTTPCERCAQRNIECVFALPKKRGRKFADSKGSKGSQTSPSHDSNQAHSADSANSPDLSPFDSTSFRDDEEISIFSSIPAFDANMLQDIINEIPSSNASHTDKTADSRFSYMDTNRRPLRSLETTISFFRYHMSMRLTDPSKKIALHRILDEGKKLIRDYDILDWKSFSIYTAYFLRDTVQNDKIDQSDDPIAIWSTTGVLLFFNISMYVLLGWNPEEMYNKDEHPHRGPLHITHPEDICNLLEQQFTALSNPRINHYFVELRVKNKQDQEIKASVFTDIKRNPAGVPILFVGKFFPKFENLIQLSK